MRPSSAPSVAARGASKRVALRVCCVARPTTSSVAPLGCSTSTSCSATANPSICSAPLPALAVSALSLQQLMPLAAAATDGEYGILEGRTAALVHPAMEFILLAATLYAGYLGWQWRRTRELGEEIRALKAAAAGAPEGSPLSPEVEGLEKERKALLSQNPKDKHHVVGSFLLAAGVGMAIEGCANTFMRTGKLFPGPHLYAGAFICALWAAAAACVPAMQKGDSNARTLHIALNGVQVLLFLSQVPSGLEIVGKVFQFTSWP